MRDLPAMHEVEPEAAASRLVQACAAERRTAALEVQNFLERTDPLVARTYLQRLHVGETVPISVEHDAAQLKPPPQSLEEFGRGARVNVPDELVDGATSAEAPLQVAWLLRGAWYGLCRFGRRVFCHCRWGPCRWGQRLYGGRGRSRCLWRRLCLLNFRCSFCFSFGGFPLSLRCCRGLRGGSHRGEVRGEAWDGPHGGRSKGRALQREGGEPKT